MEGDKLYSIKWYRNGHEFYRYIPTDNPKTTIFNGNGINVDVSTYSRGKSNPSAMCSYGYVCLSSQ